MRNMRMIHRLYLLAVVLFLFALFNLAAVYSAIDRPAADGRIVNYIGIIRGESQRIVKLELMQSETDEQINKVEQIVLGLANGSSTLELPPPQNPDLQERMVSLQEAWEQLFAQIQRFRGQSIQSDRLIEESEQFWDLANETVFALEALAQRNIKVSKSVTVFIFISFCVLLTLIALTIRKITLQLNHSARILASSSNQITATIEEQERTASQQAASVNQTTTTMDELGASSRQSAEQAEAAANAAQQALNLADGGTHAVGQTLEGMNGLKEKVGAIAEQILRLSEQTTEIGSISQLVSDLANQTNMLALNAAVEAVRAGEHGKGFSVVAAEIRKLADRSKQSAQKINDLVNDIQHAINSTVAVTDEGTKTVESNVKIARETADTFSGVADAVNNVVLNNQQIFLNIKQQATAIQQVVQAMNSINQGAKESATGISQTKLGTQQLDKATKVLKEMI
ncbi:MAG: methyl-accepting chemotaxis protein [Cyanobacteria bacterium SBLK]|nr:methyl-accepting chemotaxis protein [Cyanobacteria bacterium SBLK]